MTVKAALQSSLKYKTEKERKIADIHKKWAVSFPFAVFTFSVVRKKKKLIYKKKTKTHNLRVCLRHDEGRKL